MESSITIQLYKIEKRNQRGQSLWAIFIFILGAILAFSPLMPSGPGSIFWFWSGLIFCVLAILLGLYSLRIFPFKRKSLVKYIHHHPGRIVWVYPYIAENMPFGVKLFNLTTLYFNLDNGDNLQLRCRPHEANQLINLLKPHLQNASFGYSQEREFMYENDPKMLRRNSE